MTAAAYRSPLPYRRPFLTYAGNLVVVAQGRRSIRPSGLSRAAEATGFERTTAPSGLDRSIHAS